MHRAPFNLYEWGKNLIHCSSKIDAAFCGPLISGTGSLAICLSGFAILASIRRSVLISAWIIPC